MILLLARHARTTFNELGLANSDPTVDVRLTATGIAQAQRLAGQLQDFDLDAIYVSELPRTQQTAIFVSKAHQLDLIVDHRLNDNRTGFEGAPVQFYLDALNTSGKPFDERFNGGESLRDVVQRTASFLNDLRRTRHEVVLVVTHGLIAVAIQSHLSGEPISIPLQFDFVQGDYVILHL